MSRRFKGTAVQRRAQPFDWAAMGARSALGVSMPCHRRAVLVNFSTCRAHSTAAPGDPRPTGGTRPCSLGRRQRSRGRLGPGQCRSDGAQQDHSDPSIGPHCSTGRGFGAVPPTHTTQPMRPARRRPPRHRGPSAGGPRGRLPAQAAHAFVLPQPRPPRPAARQGGMAAAAGRYVGRRRRRALALAISARRRRRALPLRGRGWAGPF